MVTSQECKKDREIIMSSTDAPDVAPPADMPTSLPSSTDLTTINDNTREGNTNNNGGP